MSHLKRNRKNRNGHFVIKLLIFGKEFCPNNNPYIYNSQFWTCIRVFILRGLFQVPQCCNEVIQCEFGELFGQIWLTSIWAGSKQKLQQQYTFIRITYVLFQQNWTTLVAIATDLANFTFFKIPSTEIFVYQRKLYRFKGINELVLKN